MAYFELKEVSKKAQEEAQISSKGKHKAPQGRGWFKQVTLE
jgi:hypothetical protein